MKKMITVVCIMGFLLTTINTPAEACPESLGRRGECRLFQLVKFGGVAGGVLNAASMGFNVYNTVESKPMSKLRRGMTYGTIGIGAVTAGTGLALFVGNQSSQSEDNMIKGVVLGAGAATVGTGIMSLILDNKRKKKFMVNSISPGVTTSNGMASGLTLGGRF